MSDTPKQKWLSFSIRDLMWLTALVAVVLWALYAKRETHGRFAREYYPDQLQTHVFDTATGKAWVRDPGGNWTEVTPPALQKSPTP